MAYYYQYRYLFFFLSKSTNRGFWLLCSQSSVSFLSLLPFTCFTCFVASAETFSETHGTQRPSRDGEKGSPLRADAFLSIALRGVASSLLARLGIDRYWVHQEPVELVSFGCLGRPATGVLSILHPHRPAKRRSYPKSPPLSHSPRCEAMQSRSSIRISM